MAEISASARRELVQAVAGRYRIAQPGQKHEILDEFVAITGYHRKHAIRVLNAPHTTTAGFSGRRRPGPGK
jgi:hypothetical protein